MTDPQPVPEGAIDPGVFAASRDLPSHRKALERVLAYFQADATAVGLLLSGSLASGAMDPSSDLDIVVVYADAAAREAAWAARREWELGAWLHRCDADHIKPYFEIYLLEPGVKVDLVLHTMDGLPDFPGGVFRVVWDRVGSLAAWAQAIGEQPRPAPDWSTVSQEEERFWTSLFYLVTQIERGEYDEAARFFEKLRDVVEVWLARLAGDARFEARRAELRYPRRDLTELGACFPPPERRALKTASLRLLAMHERQRQEISDRFEPVWRTRDVARTRIEAMVKAL